MVNIKEYFKSNILFYHNEGLLSVLLLTLVFPIQSYFGKKSSVHI